MCALSDTTLGPKSCVRSVGHASRATHGENVRIVSPSQWAHSAAVARHASAWTAGCGSARGAREGRGARVEEADDGGGVERAAGRAGRGFRRLPRVVRRVVAEILLGDVSLGLVARRVGVGRRNLAIVPRTARGPSSAHLSERRPSVRVSWSRASAIRVGATGSGG